MTVVALIFGGRSPEHEVSIVSARNVNKNLKKAGLQVYPIGIDRAGRWWGGEEAFEILCNNTQPDSDVSPVQVLSQSACDVVFPLVHGVTGEDGCIQGMCKLLNLPYVGGDPLNQSLCWDKLATRTILANNGLPQPRFLGFFKHEFDEGRAVQQIESTLDYPVFIKPSRTGSSIGVSKAHCREDLIMALGKAFEYDYRIIVEENIDGQEIEIAGLGSTDPQLSIPAQIIPGSDFYDFSEKYLNSGTRFVIPAPIEPHRLDELKAIARKAWVLLNCYGLSRIDFMVSKNGVYLNEVNTVPGFTAISMYPALMEKSGVSPVNLMKKLVELALKRDELLACKDHFETSQNWYKDASHD